jgi:hypothetical protein
MLPCRTGRTELPTHRAKRHVRQAWRAQRAAGARDALASSRLRASLRIIEPGARSGRPHQPPPRRSRPRRRAGRRSRRDRTLHVLPDPCCKRRTGQRLMPVPQAEGPTDLITRGHADLIRGGPRCKPGTDLPASDSGWSANIAPEVGSTGTASIPCLSAAVPPNRTRDLSCAIRKAQIARAWVDDAGCRPIRTTAVGRPRASDSGSDPSLVRDGLWCGPAHSHPATRRGSPDQLPAACATSLTRASG